MEPDQTVPDQTLSITEIIQRYTKGLPLGGVAKVELWDGSDSFDDFLPDPKTLDLAEIQDLREQALEELRDITLRAQQKPIKGVKESEENAEDASRKLQFEEFEKYLNFKKEQKSQNNSTDDKKPEA